MIITEKGTAFLGYTSSIKCPNCSNLTHMSIRQEYLNQTFLFVKTKPTYGQVFKVCPICESAEKLLGLAFIGSSKLQAMYERVQFELDSGKEKTKIWMDTLSPNDKEAILKRLNDLKAFSLVKYYSNFG